MPRLVNLLQHREVQGLVVLGGGVALSWPALTSGRTFASYVAWALMVCVLYLMSRTTQAADGGRKNERDV